VPQFRVLVFLNRKPGASWSEVSDHLGLTPPSTSKLIDGLVGRQPVGRHACTDDRRKITLTLTDGGESLKAFSHQETRARFEERLSVLPEPDRAIVIQAMRALRPIFTPGESNANP